MSNTVDARAPQVLAQQRALLQAAAAKKGRLPGGVGVTQVLGHNGPPARPQEVHQSVQARLRPLSEFQAAAQAPLQLTPLAHMDARMSHLSGNPNGGRVMTLNILLRVPRRGPGAGPAIGRGGQVMRRATATRFGALERALGYLGKDEDEDGLPGEGQSEDDRLALILPVRGEPKNAQELADLLQGAKEDPEELWRILQDVLPFSTLPKDPEALYHLLKNDRFDPPRLMARLRQAVGLPPRAQLRRELREDLLEEYLEQRIDPLVVASHNAEAAAIMAAKSAKDSATFLDVYTELLDKAPGLWETLKLLVRNYPPSVMDKMVVAIMRALTDELAAATQSRDPVWLRLILEALADSHIADTFRELCIDLCRMVGVANASQLAPAPAVPPAGRARG